LANSKKKCCQCGNYFRNAEVIRTLIGMICNKCLSDRAIFSQDEPHKTIGRKTGKDTGKKKMPHRRNFGQIKSVPELIKLLTKCFNEFIRLRDTDENRAGTCISCGKWLVLGHFAEAGHFIPSTYSAVRFDENNVNLQCKRCNRHLHGNLTEYEEKLRIKIGNEPVDMLKTKKHNKVKWSVVVLEILIDQYKAKVKRLRKGKTL